MRFLLFLVYFTQCTLLLAQKPPLEQTTAMNWPAISTANISNDGKYAIYIMGPLGEKATLVLQSTDGAIKRQLPGGSRAFFTEDSRHLIFSLESDTIAILDILSDELKFICQVADFQTPAKGDGHWFAYRLKSIAPAVNLLNLDTKEERRYSNVQSYRFSDNGKVLILQEQNQNLVSMNTIVWIDPENGKRTDIGRGYNIRNLGFNINSTALAILAQGETNARAQLTLRYYQPGMDSAEIVVDNNTRGMNGMALAQGLITFSAGNDKIFFYIEKQNALGRPKRGNNLAKVHVWNYEDMNFQFETSRRPCLAVFHLHSEDGVISLQKDHGDNGRKQLTDSYLEVEGDIMGQNEERFGCITDRPDIFVVSTVNGARTLVKERLLGPSPEFSPMGKYLIWFDEIQHQWITYNVTSRITKNITAKIPYPLFYVYHDQPGPAGPEGIAGWLDNDAGLLVYDQFDLWLVDPNGIKPPVNVTQGYGRRNNIQFKVLNFDREGQQPIHMTDTLIFSAFDLQAKNNGFLQFSLSGRFQPQALILMPQVCYFPWPHDDTDLSGIENGMYPLKAKNAGVYLVKRMSPTEYPNLYITRDFKQFRPLTNLAPQHEYNWYTTSIIHWTLPDKRSAEGILYKPENFDSKKKYPTIFYIYEGTSNALNVFIHPALSNGRMNIPWYVSNGYLVFVPNIYYKNGHPGQCAYDAVVSAARFLATKPWVDPDKMGLQGHSFGGFETNYIVSKTSLFAAAAPAAGTSNLISAYGRLQGIYRGQWFYEYGQGRIGATLWQRPEQYIENSAIFRADKVTTPLLILHDKEDGTVYFDQSSEWYSCLNRLGKKAWMLSYEGENHTIENQINQLDYSIRLSQFFDYYLKDAPPPSWMVKPMTAGESGLELDTSGMYPR
jgi:dienelactone hydrolase